MSKKKQGDVLAALVIAYFVANIFVAGLLVGWSL